jgi:cell wall-associated NlpC family hydrolase
LDALQFDNGLNIQWRSAVDAHKLHAHREFPKEAVGLISQSGDYHPCTNIADTPETHFMISEAERWAVDEGRAAALLHSHTATPHPVTGQTRQPKDAPSTADMVGQAAMAIPWGISLCIESGAVDPFWFGDQVMRPPLYGRVFRHGVNDCYAFIRDWYRDVAGIAIPDFPRDTSWWEAGTEGEPPLDLYAQGFAEAGFSRVDRNYNPLPGDVFLCRVRSPVLNHGGVYLGNGMIGHHVMEHLSLYQPAEIWRNKLDFLVRHKDLPDNWRPDNVQS